MRLWWMFGVFSFGLMAGGPVWAQNAKQLGHTAEEGATDTTLTFAWRSPSGGKDTLSVVVSTAEVAADKAVKRKIQLQDLYVEMAKAARKSGKTRKKVQLTAKAGPGGVQLGAQGPAKAAKAAMAEAQTAMEQRRQEWLVENQVFEVKPGSLSHDHVAVVADRAAAVAPVAAALRAGTASDREFVARALAFSQAIPYQKNKRGTDTGFQRPMALLARNKGDCDGKSALFLSLVRAELPAVPLAMIYVPGHALTGVGLPPEEGDKSFTADGVTFIYAEPVGPLAAPLGQTAPANKRAGKSGTVRIVL
jgi:hypothetical protein